MNTVIGVIILVFQGQIADGQFAGVYPTLEACKADLHARVAAVGDPPAGAQIGIICTDLGENLKAAPPAPKAEPKVKPYKSGAASCDLSWAHCQTTAFANDVPVEPPPPPERSSFDDCTGSPSPDDSGMGCRGSGNASRAG